MTEAQADQVRRSPQNAEPLPTRVFNRKVFFCWTEKGALRPEENRLLEEDLIFWVGGLLLPKDKLQCYTDIYKNKKKFVPGPA